jgi:hypothetical protein
LYTGKLLVVVDVTATAVVELDLIDEVDELNELKLPDPAA